jgi:lipopolysaccharide transport system permease protein
VFLKIAMFQALNPIKNISALGDLLSLLRERRRIVVELAKRDLVDAHAGEFLGGFWTYAHPIFLMLVYGFVFNFIFNSRLPPDLIVPADYSVYLFSGLIPWMSVQGAMSKGSSLILAHSNLVKQVVFPIEIIPLKAALASAFPLLLSLFVLIVYLLTKFGVPPWTWMLLPALLVLHFAFMTGLIMLFGAITVFVRDIREVVTMFALAGVFLMPIIYLPRWVPEAIRPVLYVNPFSHMVWCFQDVFFFGRIEHPWSWLVFAFVSIGSLTMGFRLFRRFQPHFANVI